ncbi:MAG: YigZ family protein [Candidatus Sericytochromatia bacterium]|nr:YigZ family protein [Candidatus Sericytochromatia bacterium]
MSVYQTLAQPATAEIEILHSRFIASGTAIDSPKAAESFLAEIRQQHPDANHHCYAFQLLDPPLSERFSDDGEPNGTAGRPILTVLSHQLSNTIIVVTRYFGGTKLGKGGLVKAYTQAAQALLTSAEKVTREPMSWLQLHYPYPLDGSLSHWLQQHQLTAEKDYSEAVSARVYVPTRLLPALQGQLQEWQGQGLRWENLDAAS